MAALHYVTRHMTAPQGKPRVYFCCHPEDHARYFDTVTKEILRLSDCAIYYFDPTETANDARYEQLSAMQLFVIPVTARLLGDGCDAIDLDLPFALNEHIPVLPLMQEGGLETRFAQRFGNLQFLDRTVRDVTAVPYEEKLQKFLGAVLTGDELAAKVRAAFDAYVFLSYRKKNRKEAQELMRLIHQNEACRDIAIWYDEFLTPGEDFGEAIRLALHKSAVFLLTVTPDLLEQGNYVAEHEYPEATENQKVVVPVEMRPTEAHTLAKMYPALPACINPHDTAAFTRALTEALLGVALRQRSTPEHDFFIGLAYLEGIDVEVNTARAVELIRAAAEAGLTEAVEKLSNMYACGQGVPRDAAKATEWKQQLILCRIRDFRAEPTEQNTLLMLDEQRDLADVLVRTDDVAQAKQLYQQVAEVAQSLFAHFPSSRAAQHRAAAQMCLGHIALQSGEAETALSQYHDAEQWLLKALKEQGVAVSDTALTLSQPSELMTTVLLADLCVCLCGMGDVLLERGQQRQSVDDMLGAQSCFDRALAYLQSDCLKDGYAAYAHHLSVLYDRQGTMAYCRADDENARRYYELALRLDEQRLSDIHETHDYEAWDSYAVSCFRLALVDPERPDRAYLEKAHAIWSEMVRLAPELTVYATRLSEVERAMRMYPSAAPAPAPKEEAKPVSAPKTEPKCEIKPTPAPKTEPTPAPAPSKAEPTAEENFAAWLARAEQGELEAQSEVASLYFSGKGTEKDFDRAVQWAAKSLSGDGNKKPYAQAMYILIVHCMFDLPENYVGYSNYKNAAGWARSAARHGYYSPLGTMEIRCGYGRYKSKWRVLYWKLLGAIAPRWYPLRKRLRRLF